MARKAIKAIKYDTIQRGTNDYIPITLTRQVFVDPETGEPLDEPIMVPYDLTGKVLVLTVKKKEYDGLRNSKKWQIELKDESTPESDIDPTLIDPSPWEKDYLFRVTIDCDDPTEGTEGPEDDEYYWQNNYQGMYGLDPTQGRAVFRLSKKMTMVNPGPYNFDIRLMEKMHKKIGMVEESRNWVSAFGVLEIQGTPTNRTAIFDWRNP